MKHLLGKWYLCLVVFAGGTLGSCNHSFLFDGEGNCSEDIEGGEVIYQVQFKYDYNMDYADAFTQEVNHVTLYVINDSGHIVWQRTEEGSALAREGYVMKVEVEPGNYSLLAWCGTTDKNSFSVPSATTVTDLQCRLNRNYTTEGTAYSDTDLDRWFYGYLDSQRFPEAEGTYLYTVSLVKDTNVFHIALEYPDGGEVDVEKFFFTITADNGLMDWDNSLLDDEDINYYAWHTYEGTTDAEPFDTRATTTAAIGELTTARLVKGKEPYLTVTNTQTREILFHVPLIDYTLRIKANYDAAMGDQEFLDREDEWEMVFLLDEEDKWLPAVIYINSWRVVLQETGF